MTMTQRTRILLASACVSIASCALAGRAGAQESQLDLHGNFAVTTDSHTRSWGAGVGGQFTFGPTSAPLRVSLSPSLDYLKQQSSGPSQETLSVDASVQPGGSSTITPYVGASAGANWSSGAGKQWEGTKLGLELLGGAQVKLGSGPATLKAEERFGYVDGQEHTLTTRVGVLLKL
jgi:hypothetical protein